MLSAHTYLCIDSDDMKANIVHSNKYRHQRFAALQQKTDFSLTDSKTNKLSFTMSAKWQLNDHWSHYICGLVKSDNNFWPYIILKALKIVTKSTKTIVKLLLLTTPLSPNAPPENRGKYPPKPYTAKNQIPLVIFHLLIVWIHLHSNYGGLPKPHNASTCLLYTSPSPRD